MTRSPENFLLKSKFIRRSKSTKSIISLNSTQRTIPYPLSLDCLINIIEYLKNDRATLYSCVMVNRIWCKTSIPLLWSRPFEHQMIGKEVRILHTYISCLNFHDKAQLIDHGIQLPDMPNPIFDYPKYLRGFDNENFDRAIEDWMMMLCLTMDSDYEIRIKLCNRIIGNLLLSRTNGLRVLKIDRGEIEDSCLMNIVNLNNNYKAFSELERFELKFDNDDEEKWILNSEYKALICSQLATYTRSLSHITISIDPFRRSPPPPFIVCPSVFELISSQDKLEFLDMEEFWDEFTYTAVFYSSLQSQAHSITHLTLTNLTEFDLLLSVLVSCVNLQTLEFLMVPEPNMESFDYITNLRRPLSVKKLISYDARSEPQLVTQSLGIIIKMANKNLRALMLFEVTSELIDIIGQNCPNIVDLYLTMSTSSISHLLNFLPSLPLEYLFLWEDHSMPFTHEFVLQIARSIPATLQNLEITFDMPPEVMYDFLWECPAKFRELVLRVDGCDDEFLEIVTMYAKKKGGYLRALKLWGLGIKFSVEAVAEAMETIPRIVNLASYPLW
ncbi:20019_t:CDS:1 [Dentiscutata erythropus]|uniref:20019_t:CDS:1 n=1 Tax=Dentiscutata erythropus TaxID=1348616 RepID=A0A9N9P0R4_9GLOM|nr:20019_t:CDS:1 [Dentiscutata erythropus]